MTYKHDGQTYHGISRILVAGSPTWNSGHVAMVSWDGRIELWALSPDTPTASQDILYGEGILPLTCFESYATLEKFYRDEQPEAPATIRLLTADGFNPTS